MRVKTAEKKKTIVISISLTEKIKRLNSLAANQFGGDIDWNHYIEPAIIKRIKAHKRLVIENPSSKCSVQLSKLLLKKMDQIDNECQEKGWPKIDWSSVLEEEYKKVTVRLSREIKGSHENDNA